MKTILITGANRGIGLGLTKAYLSDGWTVLATYREKPAGELDKLAKDHSNLNKYQLDLEDETSLDCLSDEINDQKIDILFNNAATLGFYDQSLGNLNAYNWSRTFFVNTIMPIMIAKNNFEGLYYYKSSKTALNSAAKNLSNELIKDHITTIMLHPGWVKTDLGGPDAEVNIIDSVKGIKSVIENISLSDNGKFFDFKREEIKW